MSLIKKSDKIFVAGANGMVGSALCRKLKSNGYGIEKLKGEIFTPSRKELNLEEYKDVDEWFKKYSPSVIIIAAAEVGGIIANNSRPADFILKNLKIQTNLIDIAFKSKAKRLLFLGSSCIYPKFATQPITEDSLLTKSLEETNQWYAIAKISGLKLCQSLRKQYGFDAFSLMPTNLYGENDNYDPLESHVLPALIRKFWIAKEQNLKKVICWGSGTPLREFLYVDDLADACLFTLEKWDPPKNNFDSLNWLNVGSKFEISIKDLASKIANIIGYKGEIEWDKNKPDGTPRKKLDTTKLSLLGWEAKTNLDEGILKTINSLKKRNARF